MAPSAALGRGAGFGEAIRTDTPSNDANRDCENPVFSRIVATSGTLIPRPID